MKGARLRTLWSSDPRGSRDAASLQRGGLARLVGLATAGDAEFHASKVQSLRQFLLLETAVQAWIFPDYRALPILCAVGLLGAGILGMTTHRARLALRLCFVFVTLRLALMMPMAANHPFLEVVVVGLAALCDRENPREQALFLDGCRWMVIIVLGYSGLQKLWYGAYFQGEFLAVMVAVDPRFQSFFAHVLPDEELRHLVALGGGPGSGPYLFQSFGAVALSNGVYVAEILLAPMLLFFRGRPQRVAAVATILFILSVEVVAREFVFGILYVTLLLLFLRTDWIRRLMPWIVASFAALFVMRLVHQGWAFN